MILVKFAWGYDVMLKFKVRICVFSVHLSIRFGSGSGN